MSQAHASGRVIDVSMSTRKFCLLTTERTGSNYVRQLLSSFPGSVFYGELFNPVHLPQPIVDLGFSISDRDRDPLGFLARVEGLPHENAAFFGFKLMMDHCQLVLDYVLASKDYSLIVMSRRNKLAQYSSLLIARTSGVWHVHRGEIKGPEPKVPFDSNTFARFVAKDARRYDALWRRLRASQQRYCGLHYAPARNHDHAVALLDFVGIKPGCSVSDLLERNPCVRQNAARILHRFSNPEVVVKAMREIGHEDWLEEEAS